MEIDVELAAKLATKDDIQKATRKPQPPLRIRRVNTGIAVTGTPTNISLGYPAAGRLWNVLSLAVVGSDDHTAVAGSTVATYSGDPTSPSLAQLAIPGTVGTLVPWYNDLGLNVLWIESMSELFLLINGATTGQSLTAVMYAYDFRQSDMDPTNV